MVRPGLIDLADETLVRIAEHLVFSNGLWDGGFASVIPLTGNARQSSPRYRNDIVAFLSTCRRVQQAVKPFGLAYWTWLDGDGSSKSALARIPQRFLKAIT